MMIMGNLTNRTGFFPSLSNWLSAKIASAKCCSKRETAKYSFLDAKILIDPM